MSLSMYISRPYEVYIEINLTIYKILFRVSESLYLHND